MLGRFAELVGELVIALTQYYHYSIAILVDLIYLWLLSTLEVKDSSNKIAKFTYFQNIQLCKSPDRYKFYMSRCKNINYHNLAIVSPFLVKIWHCSVTGLGVITKRMMSRLFIEQSSQRSPSAHSRYSGHLEMQHRL